MTASTGLLQNFAINSFSITSPALAGIQATVSNFWTGNSVGSYLTGEFFPAIVRISGNLQYTAADLALVKKLSVFFDNLNFFSY